MPRPMTHRWGKRFDPRMAPTLLGEDTINKLLTPLHISATLLPLGLFSREHADHACKIINLVAADSASKGNGLWQVADKAATAILSMKHRADNGEPWDASEDERQVLIEAIIKMDRYIRTWTNRRFMTAAVTVDTINARAKAEGGKFMDRVEI